MADDSYATETWRSIPRHENYSASSAGRIRGASGKVLTPVLTQYGYHQVTLCGELGSRFTRFVHRLVATTFIGPQPTPEHDVLHWDGDRTHNSLVNLRWGTPKENNADQERLGRRIRGETHPHSKLNEGLVRSMREKFDSGKTVMEISQTAPVHYRVVWNAVHRKTWKHVA